MLKKRLTALLCAGVMTIEMAGMSVNYAFANASPSELEKLLSDYTEIDTHNVYSGRIGTLYNNNENPGKSLNVIEKSPHTDFYLKDDLSKDKFETIVKNFDPNCKVAVKGGVGYGTDNIKVCYMAYFEKDYSIAELREISNAVNEKAEVSKAEYNETLYEVNDVYGNLLNFEGKLFDELSSYVEINNYDFKVEKEEIEIDSENITYSICKLTPEKELTPQEQFDMAYRIQNDLGIKINLAILDNIAGIYGGNVIEFVGNIEGDANNDGDCTIADAVAILQYLANSAKYPLSAQGLINADFDGDGITGADALAIQKMDATKTIS